MSVARSLSLPTGADDWRRMVRTARLVVSGPTYAAVAVLATLVAPLLFALPQNRALFVDVVLAGSLPLDARLDVLLSLHPLLAGTGYTAAQLATFAVSAPLVGVNVAMVVYHLREHGLSARESSGSLLGLVLGTLGAGCATCGAALLAGLLSLVGAGGLLAALPLDGLEFLLLAVLVLVLSIHWIAEGLRGGRVRGCPVDP